MTIQVPDYILNLVPYVPGKPIEETQREFKLKKVIKLASNENPLGPSPKAVQAMKAQLKGLHRYPDSSGFHLKAALAKFLGLTPKNFTLGNGSNEVIDQLVRTFCVPGDAIVTHRASFLAYKLSAQIHGVNTLEAQIRSDLKCDLNEVVDLVKNNLRVKIVFLANPNNPTGTYLNKTEVLSLIQELLKIRGGSVLLVLDDAYSEYVTAKDFPSALSLFSEYPNLVVLRTFSKVYGLAGIRVGYGIASEEIISHIEKVRQPFNLNSLGLAAAEAALSDRAFVRKSKSLNVAGMKLWEKSLKKKGIPFWSSQGNFLLANVQIGLGLSGLEVYQHCLSRGVIFRPVHNYGLSQAIRITVGLPEENKKGIEILTQWK